MKKFLRNAFEDIKNRKNLELYIMLLVSITIVVIDILGVETEGAIIELVLASLAILIYGLINNTQTQSRIEEKVEQLSLSIEANDRLSEWNQQAFSELIKSSSEISFILVTSSSLFRRFSAEFKYFLSQNGRLRLIYVDPNSDAFQIASEQSMTAPGSLEYLKSHFVLTVHMLDRMLENAPNLDNIQIRISNFLPSSAVTMFDHSKDTGTISLALNAFRQGSQNRPSLTLRKQVDDQWFQFFVKGYESLWDYSKVVSLEELVDLAEKLEANKKGN